MSRRYGRNQKRQARTKIADLESQLLHLTQKLNETEVKAQIAQRRAIDADERAFSKYVASSGLLEAYINQIATEMGRALGHKLLPHAQRLRASDRRARISTSPTLTASIDDCAQVMRIEGVVPELHYRVNIAAMEFALFAGSVA